MAAVISVPADEKRQVIGIVYWNPQTDMLEIDVPDGRDFELSFALLRQYLPRARFTDERKDQL